MAAQRQEIQVPVGTEATMEATTETKKIISPHPHDFDVDRLRNVVPKSQGENLGVSIPYSR